MEVVRVLVMLDAVILHSQLQILIVAVQLQSAIGKGVD
jgi:hypothetical protein